MFERAPLFGSEWRFSELVLPEQDLVAVGGDLDISTILSAYECGMFPMPFDGELAWWSPQERGVLVPSDVRVSVSLRKSMKKFSFTVNHDFEQVIMRCADPDRPQGWITDEIRQAYLNLHEAGWAHSVETRDREGRLVGGLYGLAIGDLFCGESMFHLERDASKAALVHLTERMSTKSDGLIDTQWVTPHLATLGVRAMDRQDYLRRIGEIIDNSSVI